MGRLRNWWVDGHETILGRGDELRPLHCLLLITFDVVVSHGLQSLLLGRNLVLEYLMLDRVFTQLLLFGFQIGLPLLELFVESLLMRLEVADLLALQLVSLTFVLQLLSLPFERLLLDAILVKLFLESVILADDFIVFFLVLGKLLIELLFFLYLRFHAALNCTQLLGQFSLLPFTFDFEILLSLSDSLLFDVPLV